MSYITAFIIFVLFSMTLVWAEKGQCHRAYYSVWNGKQGYKAWLTNTEVIQLRRNGYYVTKLHD